MRGTPRLSTRILLVVGRQGGSLGWDLFNTSFIQNVLVLDDNMYTFLEPSSSLFLPQTSVSGY